MFFSRWMLDLFISFRNKPDARKCEKTFVSASASHSFTICAIGRLHFVEGFLRFRSVCIMFLTFRTWNLSRFWVSYTRYFSVSRYNANLRRHDFLKQNSQSLESLFAKVWLYAPPCDLNSNLPVTARGCDSGNSTKMQRIRGEESEFYFVSSIHTRSEPFFHRSIYKVQSLNSRERFANRSVFLEYR